MITTCLLPALLVPQLSLPQVHVVDDDPGADFSSLQAAVDAAQDGDTILVRDGIYDSIWLDGRSLTIAAEVGASVELHRIDVRNVAADQSVFLRRLTTGYQGLGAGDATSGARFEDCAGTVVVDGCTLFGVDLAFNPLVTPIGLIADNCDDVWVVDSSLRGRFGLSNLGGRVSAFDCEVSSFDGPDAGVTFLGSAEGGDARAAIYSEAGVLFLSGCLVTGGDGGQGSTPDPGSPFTPPCGNGGDGGDAIEPAMTQVTLRETSLVPGSGGPGGAPLPGGQACVSGAGGQPFGGPLASLSQLDGPARHFDVSPNPIREGQDALLSFQGGAGDAVLWTLSLQHTNQTPLDFGGPVLIGGTPFIHGFGTADPLGVLSATVPFGSMTPGVEAIGLIEQAFFIAPDGARAASQPRKVMHLDSSF